MNFDKDYKEFIEWEKTKGGTSGPTEFTAEEDVSIRLFVAYLNCRYAPPSPNQPLKSDGQGCAVFDECNLKEKAGCNDCDWRKPPAV